MPNAVSNCTNFYDLLQMRVIANRYTNRMHIDWPKKYFGIKSTFWILVVENHLWFSYCDTYVLCMDSKPGEKTVGGARGEALCGYVFLVTTCARTHKRSTVRRPSPALCTTSICYIPISQLHQLQPHFACSYFMVQA